MPPRPIKDNPKSNQYRLRLSDEELEMLDFCCNKLGMKKSEILMAGLKKMYELAKRSDK